MTSGYPGEHASQAGRGPGDMMALLSGQPSPEMLRELLCEVIDPEIGINIVDLGLVYDVRLSADGAAAVVMTLTTPGCPLGGYIEDSIRETLWGTPGVTGLDVQIVWEPPWEPERMMSDWAKQQLGWR
ncbi:MAG TPA: metal-sulfur cluster assembly factor [Streptosporangiaceae bacterium]|nr:metal-sulfur cluster assembly factor [Streptosporangiaceae bacterium]